MKIALFGGTFDPIHSGHLQAARVATLRYGLDRILFVPSGYPPHKPSEDLTEFAHRYAMVTLACARDPRFVASLLEAPHQARRPAYTIDTVRKVKRQLQRKDTLFFLLGADAFLDVPHWKHYGQLLDLVNFIVVTRPGFDRQDLRNIVPPKLLATSLPPKDADTILLRRTAVHILRGVNSKVASREVREAVRDGRRITGLVPRLVEEYIRKEGLYHPRKSGATGR